MIITKPFEQIAPMKRIFIEYVYVFATLHCKNGTVQAQMKVLI